uniref:Uncharacterized protein n=1 Tax=Rheinheimera sp. BAL341 TaxID=1708203 RepID=A0A486XGH4_9GAMM
MGDFFQLLFFQVNDPHRRGTATAVQTPAAGATIPNQLEDAGLSI